MQDSAIFQNKMLRYKENIRKTASSSELLSERLRLWKPKELEERGRAITERQTPVSNVSSQIGGDSGEVPLPMMAQREQVLNTWVIQVMFGNTRWDPMHSLCKYTSRESKMLKRDIRFTLWMEKHNHIVGKQEHV